MSRKKSVYQPPTMVRLQSAHHSKFGLEAPEAYKRRSEIDGVSVSELVETHGSPLFVFSENTIREKYRAAQAAFASNYSNVQFAWSYKTNYLKSICQVFHEEGSYAEVVSEFEYEKARGLGVPGNQIIFNGPFKSEGALRRAASEGAYLHVDNLSEIDTLEKIAKEMKKEIPVALRVNMNCGVQPQWTRFGFNLESGQAADVLRRIALGKRLKVRGIHTHIGTFILDPNCYAVAVQKLCEFMKWTRATYGWECDYLDIGGGFPSLSQLIGIYQPPDISVPSIETFAKAIGQALKQHLPKGAKPKLFVEAGRHLIDEAGFLITTVQARKLLPDGVPSYVLDAGVNVLYTSRWYRFNFEVDRELKGPVEYSLLHGPLCMNIDVVCDYLSLPSMPRGTRLILSPVGAYNLTQSMSFIQYRPAVVMIRPSGAVEVIKERESLESIEYDEKLLESETPRKRKAA